MHIESFALTVADRARRKVLEFASLSEGWCYGQGDRISEETVRTALVLTEYALTSGIGRTNAFPGLNGEITVVFYVEDDDFEFTIETDGRISFLHEHDGDTIEEELLTLPAARQKIQGIARLAPWTIYGSYIPDITTKKESAFGATPLLHTGMESPLLAFNVSASREPLSAGTSERTMGSRPLGNLRSSGHFDLKAFRQEAA